MYFEEKFDCMACGYDFERESNMQECRKCHDTYCDQCIDSKGACVPCWE